MDPKAFQNEAFRKLKNLILDLTHSGLRDLTVDELTRVKTFTNEGEEFVRLAHKELIHHLKETHSEVRFTVVQLMNELFCEYENFRNLVLDDLDKLFKLGMGIKSSDGLPPPGAAASKLLQLTISVVDQWHRRFGPKYLKLRTAHKYLKDVQMVDFSSLEIVDPKEKLEREEKERRMKSIHRERLKNTNKSMEEITPDIECALTSLESCFQLLLPAPDETLGGASSGSFHDRRLNGIVTSLNFELEIKLDRKIKIEENEETSAILDAAKDSFLLINNKFLPKVTAWIELITTADGEPNLMTTALSLKEKLEAAVAKYNRLEVVRTEPMDQDEVSSDSDLEEVVEEKTQSRSTREEVGFLSEILKNRCDEKPKDREIKPKMNIIDKISAGSSERKKKLLELAPKLPFDIDLYHWEDEKLPTPVIQSGNFEGSSFWAATDPDEMRERPVPGGSEVLRSRVIEFTGKWEPVDHTCKVPLPSGRLCPRKDRIKCPLHGPIVPRDDTGKVTNPSDELKLLQSQPNRGVPDWQDPKLLAELKRKTGLDLRIPKKGERRKKDKFPGLTDLKKKKDTPEARISKKIFKKSSLKRVAATLDQIDHRKHRDKFGDQFNYVHNC